MLWIKSGKVHKVPNIKKYVFLIVIFCVNFCFSQTISAFRLENKWGFKLADKVIIDPQYDTVFGFDPSNKVCLVGKTSPLKRSINSLTKEVRKEYIYNYINPSNKKLYVSIPDTKDSVCDFSLTKEAVNKYLNNKNYFIVNYNSKEIILDKNGKQITEHGFDNVTYSKVDSFFITETKDTKSAHVFLGLINAVGKQVIPPTYSKISFNPYDTLIYCCTAGIRFNGSDDVFNYKGEKLHSHNKHIQCATRNYTVFRLFESENSYAILDNKTLKEKPIKAEYVYYLKNDNIVLLDGDWFFYNLATEKKIPIDKKIIKYLHLDE